MHAQTRPRVLDISCASRAIMTRVTGITSSAPQTLLLALRGPRRSTARTRVQTRLRCLTSCTRARRTTRRCRRAASSRHICTLLWAKALGLCPSRVTRRTARPRLCCGCALGHSSVLFLCRMCTKCEYPTRTTKCSTTWSRTERRRPTRRPSACVMWRRRSLRHRWPQSRAITSSAPQTLLLALRGPRRSTARTRVQTRRSCLTSCTRARRTTRRCRRAASSRHVRTPPCARTSICALPE